MHCKMLNLPNDSIKENIKKKSGEKKGENKTEKWRSLIELLHI